MDKQNEIIHALNEFLEGEYIGIHAYELFINQTKDEKLRSELQAIQQEHKIHAILVAERVQNLGGQAVDDIGIRGKIGEMFMRIKGLPNSSEGIISEVIEGEEKGVKKLQEIVVGQLDEESIHLIEEIVHEDQKHVQHLKALLH